jgi:hypothetical protein
VAILKQQLGLIKTLNEILQICSVNIFAQVPALEALAAETDEECSSGDEYEAQKCLAFRDL